MTRLFIRTLLAATFICLAGTASADDAAAMPSWLEPGSNTMLREKMEIADGLSVIISDVVIPPQTEVPPHTHPGEEYVYVIEGEAIHREEGQEDKVYKAGDAFVIRAGKVHAPATGESPARAIVFRVHVEGEPDQTPASFN